jgi:hypothetical protein
MESDDGHAHQPSHTWWRGGRQLFGGMEELNSQGVVAEKLPATRRKNDVAGNWLRFDQWNEEEDNCTASRSSDCSLITFQ